MRHIGHMIWHIHQCNDLLDYEMLTSRKVFRSIRVFAEQCLLNNALVEPWKLRLHWMPPCKKRYLSSFWLIRGKNIEIFSTAIKTTACSHPIKNSLEFRFGGRSLSQWNALLHDKKINLNLTSHDRCTILDQWTKKRAWVDAISTIILFFKCQT